MMITKYLVLAGIVPVLIATAGTGVAAESFCNGGTEGHTGRD